MSNDVGDSDSGTDGTAGEGTAPGTPSRAPNQGGGLKPKPTRRKRPSLASRGTSILDQINDSFKIRRE